MHFLSVLFALRVDSVCSHWLEKAACLFESISEFCTSASEKGKFMLMNLTIYVVKRKGKDFENLDLT